MEATERLKVLNKMTEEQILEECNFDLLCDFREGIKQTGEVVYMAGMDFTKLEMESIIEKLGLKKFIKELLEVNYHGTGNELKIIYNFMEYKITPKKCKHCYYKTNACFNKNGIKCFIGNIKDKFTRKGIRQ